MIHHSPNLKGIHLLVLEVESHDLPSTNLKGIHPLVLEVDVAVGHNHHSTNSVVVDQVDVSQHSSKRFLHHVVLKVQTPANHLFLHQLL